MATIDNLTLEINADATKALTSLNKVSTALKNLKDSLPTQKKLEGTAQGFKTLTEQISKLSMSTKSLNQIKALGTIANSLKKMSSFSPSNLKKTAENLDALQGAMSHISYQAVEKIERLASAYSKLGESIKTLGGFQNVKKVTQKASEAQPLVESGTTTQGESTAIGKIKNEADEATKSVGGFWTKYQTVQSMIKSNPISLLAGAENTEKMSALSETLGMSTSAVMAFSKALGYVGIAISIASVGLKILKKAFEIIISPLKKAVNMVKTFVKAIARIAIYRAIRGIIKSITQGLKEGIQNLALYSKALEGLDTHNANNVMSRYASEFLYFKNAVATAVIPILRALIPYVETAINTMIKFINVLAQVGSAIFGTTYTKAKYFWVDYADSLDTASGSAKKLHHQLAGFDELNNLTAPSGGGGSDKLKDALDMFEEADIDSKIKNWVDGIVDKIKEGVAKVKTAISPYTDKLKEFFNDFKTDVYPNIKRIYENLKKLWKEVLKPILDEFIKGFIKGFTDESLKDVSDALALVTDKIADFTDWLVKMKEKIPLDKVKDFAYHLGEGAGKILGWYRPLTLVVEALKTLKERAEKTAKAISDELVAKTKIATDKMSDLKDKFEQTKEKVRDFLGKLTDLSTKFNTTKDKVNSLASILDAFRAYFNSVNPFKKLQDNAVTVGNVINAVKSLVDWFRTLGTITINFAIQVAGLDKLQQITNKVSSPATTTINSVSKLVATGHARANGGYVPKGDLFVANEKAPEMIGHIGGNTAVANNNQITEAIASATYTAMSKALSENNGNVTFVVEGDADKMFKVYQKKQREYQKTTGFAY